MSRVDRASVAAAFSYIQLALRITVGIVLVPFVLDRVGVTVYGYWLASGDVLAYAAMADLGVLAVMPWMVAQADGRKDRAALRRLLSTGFTAAVVVTVAYIAIVITLWNLAPAILTLSAADRALIRGPLALIATVTAIVLPMRIAYAALIGLQDVRYCGVMTTIAWGLDAVLTVVLLLQGYGLWALAIAASVPSAMTAVAAVVRLRIIAPDLLEAWPRPIRADVVRLFKEGGGGWLGAWGWRLASATDSIVIASLGQPVWITMLAMTAKLGQILTNMAWVPGDSGLVGLSHLAGEGHVQRLREAICALARVYLTLATAAACVVLAANPAFVGGWLGPELFAGLGVNAVLACLVIAATAVHALSTTVSVLGKRAYVGMTTLLAGIAHVVLAYVLGRTLGLIGIPIAAIVVQSGILIPALLPALRAVARVGLADLLVNVASPWGARAVPLLAASGFAGVLLPAIGLRGAIPVGTAVGLTSLFVCRRLILDYPPVANVIRRRLATLRLDGWLLADYPRQPGA